MATIALRLCYTPRGGATPPPPSPPHQHQQPSPLLTVITQSFEVVWNHAQQQSQQDGSLVVSATAVTIAVHSALAAVPETVLGRPGGARARLSMDPHALQAATQDLQQSHGKSSTVVLLDLLNRLPQPLQRPEIPTEHSLIWWNHPCHPDAATAATATRASYLDVWTLHTCHAWAKYLPLSAEFLHATLPLVHYYIVLAGKESTDPSVRRLETMAFGYFIAICEGATLTIDQVLAYRLGFTVADPHAGTQKQSTTTTLSDASGSHNNNKKRQSNRSKKRQKEVVESNVTDAMRQQAAEEVCQRGEAACLATHLIWSALDGQTRRVLQQLEHDGLVQSTFGSPVDGEGPIGCLAAAANSCLPHMVRMHHQSTPNSTWNDALFAAIMDTFHGLCCSRDKTVRGLTYEPLYALNATVMETAQKYGLTENVESQVVEHFVKVSESSAGELYE